MSAMPDDIIHLGASPWHLTRTPIIAQSRRQTRRFQQIRVQFQVPRYLSSRNNSMLIIVRPVRQIKMPISQKDMRCDPCRTLAKIP